MADDRYTDWKEIGRGGFGEVYRAFDSILQRPVAIKLLKKELSNTEALVSALHREVIISRDLRHENICPIHDVYDGPKGVGTVMDLIDGIELSQWRDDNANRLLDTAQDRLTLLIKLSEALTYAHTRIIHRDLKPDNVFLLQGSPERPVIMDFGAAVVDLEAGDGMVAGTPRYMSPEQWEAPNRVDQRSDLFSLGTLAYELFTGQLPPTSLRRVVKTRQVPKVALADIPKPSSFCSAVPASLDWIIIQLLAYRQEDRPQSASEVAAALREVEMKSTDIGKATVDRDRMPEIETVSLPGGLFHLGADARNGNATERPVRQVSVSPFRMAIHPVTVRDYRTFVKATGYSAPPLLDDPQFGQPDHPVVGITYEDAENFARWVGGALPTEVQWEYAAKGGAKFPLYPWGDEPPSAARANINGVSQSTSPVDGCPMGVNPFGIHGLCGNVWEWCQDFWSPNAYRALKRGETDPVRREESETRLLRGGGFDSFATHGRCSSRFHAPPNERSRSIGFRLVFPA